MQCYCSECNKLSDVTVKSIEEAFAVKGDKIDITSEVAICNDCGSKLFHQELDNKNLDLAYSTYRKKHNILFPSEIANIRKKYLLSQRSLGKLLEWGEVTINRYENGAIQDPAHNEVLMFISDPKNMKELFEKNGPFLNQPIRNKLGEVINQLIESELEPQFHVFLEEYISSKQSLDEYSGFQKFNLEKSIQMMLYIAVKTKGVFTTKLNKLLWYMDFLSFKEYSKSISGCNYRHLPLGPVPKDYRWIIAAGIDEGLITETEVCFPSGSTGMLHMAAVSADVSQFNDDEMKLMDFVIEYFKDYNCEAIKKCSHEEKAYKVTQDNEIISYKYATDLSLELKKN